MRVLFILILLLIGSSVVHSNDEMNDLLSNAQEQLKAQNYSGDTSAGQRLLKAILERDPGHPEALWELTYVHFLAPISSAELHRRAPLLAKAGPEIKKITESAHKRNEHAFAHYVLARYATFYYQFDQAIPAINKALQYEPQNVKFMYYKGRILGIKGYWEKNDADILAGIELMQTAQKMNAPDSELQVDDAGIYFSMAYFNQYLSEPRYQSTIDYYQKVIEHNNGDQQELAFTWNNISIAYRKLNQCTKAKEAAKEALKIYQFGAAEKNLAYSEVCLEMEQIKGVSKFNLESNFQETSR